MDRQPVPSTLLFVSQLQGRSQGDKVRFLACVDKYIENDGILDLFHDFPRHRHHPPRVYVNITSILDVVKKEHLEIGAWINVIGYLTTPSKLQDKDGHRSIELPTVQAILIWSAGSINLGEYERALNVRQKAMSQPKLRGPLPIQH